MSPGERRRHWPRRFPRGLATVIRVSLDYGRAGAASQLQRARTAGRIAAVGSVDLSCGHPLAFQSLTTLSTHLNLGKGTRDEGRHQHNAPEKIRQTTAMYRSDRGRPQPGRGTGRSSDSNGGGHCRRRAVSAGLPLHAAAELDERSQRDGVLQGRLPPLLPAQSVRQPVGQHVLGTCHVNRPGALEGAAPGHLHGRPAGHLLRQRGGGQEQQLRPGHGREPSPGGDLHQRLQGRLAVQGTAGPIPCVQPG
jgi:hypothetical protein